MRDLPPLTQLRAFEAAARLLSFRGAAAELAVTPTAISHQIQSLEQHLGAALFRRRPRPLALTDMWPLTKNARPPNMRRSVTPASGARSSRMRLARSSS